MLEINLYPWRQAQLNAQQVFIKRIMWFSLLFTVSLLAVIYIFLCRQEQLLMTELAKLKQEQKKYLVHQPLIHQFASEWKQLEQKRKFDLQFFKQLSGNGQLRTCFTEIGREKNQYYFRGKANSVWELQEFLKVWQLAAWFSIITIKELTADKTDGHVNFQFIAFP